MVENPAFRYGIDYDYGDLIALSAFGKVSEARLSVVHIKLNQNGGQEVDVRFQAEAMAYLT